MSELTLYGYWRSSAAYRVRIALALKGLEAEQISVHLLKNGGEQHLEAFRKVNPHGLIPALVHHRQEGDVTITNSLAILEYLDEVFPGVRILPSDAAGRARVRQISLAIAADIHPIQNLRVLQMAAKVGGEEGPISMSWAKHWIDVGFEALEKQLSLEGESGKFCHGDELTMADICLVPQVVNAARYQVDMSRYPKISEIVMRASAHEAFQAAEPKNQPDAET
jgi:maleylacetoacetate isomerase